MSDDLVIPPAPLHPIPVIGEPFEHVILDCVGLLPKAKGHSVLAAREVAFKRGQPHAQHFRLCEFIQGEIAYCLLAGPPFSLSAAQSKMNKKMLRCTFQPGDHVLVLFPIVGSSLKAKSCGPYEVERKLSDTDYVIRMPDRKKKSCVCHSLHFRIQFIH